MSLPHVQLMIPQQCLQRSGGVTTPVPVDSLHGTKPRFCSSRGDQTGKKTVIEAGVVGYHEVSPGKQGRNPLFVKPLSPYEFIGYAVDTGRAERNWSARLTKSTVDIYHTIDAPPGRIESKQQRCQLDDLVCPGIEARRFQVYDEGLRGPWWRGTKRPERREV